MIEHYPVDQISPNNSTPLWLFAPAANRNFALLQIWALHSLFSMMIREQLFTSRRSVANWWLDASF
jgi:hypothetical protein